MGQSNVGIVLDEHTVRGTLGLILLLESRGNSRKVSSEHMVVVAAVVASLIVCSSY